MSTPTRVHSTSAKAPVSETGVNGTEALPPVTLDRASILAANDLPTEVVEVPEWGGSVLVRGLTGVERDSYDAQSWRERELAQGDTGAILSNFRARLVARAIVDASGNRLFSDNDAVALGRKSAAALERVHDVVQRLSGMDAEEVDKLAADLKAGPSAASGSG